jgi:hypothetical protein
MYRYTVTVDNQKTDLEAYDPDSAVSKAMIHFNVETAKSAKVVSSEGQRAWYIGVESLGGGWIRYEKKED